MRNVQGGSLRNDSNLAPALYCMNVQYFQRINSSPPRGGRPVAAIGYCDRPCWVPLAGR